jgi:probable phosphoglycerate mutase
MPQHIHLVRHGETAWSLTGQHTGTTDLDLTAHGEEQARSLASMLCHLNARHVLCSPRLRARRTAELAGLGERLQTEDARHVLCSPRLRARRTAELAGLGERLQTEADLCEWDYGTYEGRRTADIQQERPGWSVWRDGCPQGEMPADVAARADRLMARLLTLEGDVVLFSHGQFGAALAARWIGQPLPLGQHLALHPASLSTLSLDPQHPGRHLITLWNQTPAPHSAHA